LTQRDGELQAAFRQPFDLIITSTKAYEHKKAAGVASNGPFENWRGFVDTYRTLCLAPTPEMKAIFDHLHQLALAV
jgi:hypothetical protein